MTFTQKDANELIKSGVTVSDMEELSSWKALHDKFGDDINFAAKEHWETSALYRLEKVGLVEKCDLPETIEDPDQFIGVRMTKLGLEALAFATGAST